MGKKKEFEHKRQIVNLQLLFGSVSAILLVLIGLFIYGHEQDRPWAVAGMISFFIVGLVVVSSFNSIMEGIEAEIEH
ncbi:Uncharacterised protein [uncultured archaeon]|nr:Uncharacterised protein [uncultured archaeon]